MNLTSVAVRQCKSELLWDSISLQLDYPSARSQMIIHTGVDVWKSDLYSLFV